MNHRTAVALLIAAAAAPVQAADPLSYSFWEADYLNSGVETTVTSGGSSTSADDDVEGMRLKVGIGLWRYVHFVADYDQRHYSDARDAFWAVGVGAHTTNPAYQFFGNVTYERLDFDDNTAAAADDTDEGYGVEIGARVPFSHYEINASYKYVDFGEDGTAEITGARYGIGGVVQLAPKWALALDYRIRTHEAEDTVSAATSEVEYTEYTVGFRRYFATEADRRKRKGGIFSDEGGSAAPSAE